MVEDIRVLVVDGGPGVAHGLICGVPGDGVRVLGRVADASAALRTLEREPINLVVVDLDRPDDDGIEIVRRIREVADRTRVIGVTIQHGPDLAAGALAAGACGVVSPESNGESLVSVFRRALAGELILPAIHLSNLVDRLRDGREASTVCKLDYLTTRELEILRALADGASTAEISRSLGIRPMTVQSHVKNILAKLSVHSKVEAVTLAWRFGLGSVTRSA
ncbi:MAG: LuxR C-terminal-related transcriptional regulator [Actinomycetota bacterium]